jgi:protein-disulfide isomerase
MTNRFRSILALAAAALAGAAAPAFAFAAQQAQQHAAAPASSVESRLPGFLVNYLPYNPNSKITVERSSEKLPGFQGWKFKRTGKYPKLEAERTVWVTDDGKWFFDGDTLTNPSPKPVQSAADLQWIEQKTSGLYRTRVRGLLVPERGRRRAQGRGDGGRDGLRTDARARLRHGRRLAVPERDALRLPGRPARGAQAPHRLSTPRFEGKPDGAITIVEYADMECGYCRFRGTQMDALLEANPGLSYKRYYKFFPLWFSHVWSMKAASAADCIFRFAKNQMFAFKRQVYSQQPILTVSTIDELAITFAEAAGIPRADFLACYLRDESLSNVRKDLDEGQRLGVKSTPTYFIDGTEITWIEDKVMEDFLKTKDPNIKSIDYGRKE